MKPIVWFFIALVFVYINQPVTWACQCVGPSGKLNSVELRGVVEDHFRPSSAVFLGEVIEFDRFRVVFNIKDMWKGSNTKVIVIRTSAKYSQNMLISSRCDYPFRVGKKYLVYARTIDGDLQSLPCDGTKEWSDAAKAEANILSRLKRSNTSYHRRITNSREVVAKGGEMYNRINPTHLHDAFYQ